MRDFDPTHGWVWHYQGGPLDGTSWRTTMGQNLKADELPELWQTFRSGTYKLTRERGVTVRHRGKALPKYRYVWQGPANQEKD